MHHKPPSFTLTPLRHHIFNSRPDLSRFCLVLSSYLYPVCDLSSTFPPGRSPQHQASWWTSGPRYAELGALLWPRMATIGHCSRPCMQWLTSPSFFFASEQNLYELLGRCFCIWRVLDDACGGHLVPGNSGIPRPHDHPLLIRFLFNCRQ